MKAERSKSEISNSTEKEVDSSSQSQQVNNLQVHNKHAHRLVYGYITLLFIAAIAGICGYIYQHNQNHQKTVNKMVIRTSAPTEKSQITKSTSTVPSYEIYNQPKALGNLNFFKNTVTMFGTNCSGNNGTDCSPAVPSDQISYVQIGVTLTKQPIIVAYDYSAGVSSFYYVAIETSSGQYKLIGNLSSNFDLNSSISSDQQSITSLEGNLNSNVTLDTTDTISALTFPQNSIVRNLALNLAGDYFGTDGYFVPNLTFIRGAYHQSVKASQISKIGSSDGITFYEVTVESQPTYGVKEIYGVIGGIFAAEYEQTDPITLTTNGDNNPEIKYIDGSINSSNYVSSTFGCGSAYGYVVANGLNQNQLTFAGTGPNGESIYQLANNSALLEAYFNNSTNQISTISQLQSDHGVIVAEDALGEYVVYQRSDLFNEGGCGKPVIYLYPQKITDVSVGVEARVTSSNPTYTTVGWQNIIAQPNGNLTYEGKTYPFLFWEGTGDGVYPLITSGTVVTKSQAIPTILQQLSEQGIDHAEAQAFISYWGPRLPDTSYIRLSWLDTNQMNELAPLSITPKPTTLIRVFLDFQGLNAPISLTPQKFTTPQRKGFTVVEWGGLLRQANQNY